MKKSIWLSLTAILLFAIPSFATSLSVESGGITLNEYNFSKAGSSAEPWTINESMTSGGTLKLDSLEGQYVSPLGSPNATGSGHNYGRWFDKTITNNTGSKWTSFELELQAILGTPSLNGDGLSFADGANFIFSSDMFTQYTRIDNTRDYLNFHHGAVESGETVTFHFAITDNLDNNPFWLLQTPNKVDAPVPEPSTFILFGAGLGGLAIWRKRKQG